MKHLLLSIIIVAGLTALVHAQHSPTMYYMYEVPQASLLNPATQPRCGFYLGMPGFSSFEIYSDNSSVSLSDVLIYEKSIDSLVLPFHPTQNIDDFLKNFKKRNSFSAELNVPVLSLGFRISDETYLNFHAMARSTNEFFYPGDLTSFTMKGIESGREYDLSNMAVNSTQFMEYALGISRQLDRKLTIGVRFKLLSGIANVATRNTDISVTSSPEFATMRAKYEINANVPGLSVPIDGDSIDYDNVDFDDKKLAESAAKMQNIGFGLDIGLHYLASERLRLSASLLDLGYISWKSNPYTFTGDASYTFEGLPVAFEGNEIVIDEEELDSVAELFEPKAAKGEPYTTYLQGKLYLGGQFFLGQRANISLLSRSELNRGRLREQVTLAINVFPIKMVAASLSYSIANRTYDNIGLGINWKAGPLNAYFISDFIPVMQYYDKDEPIVIPRHARTFNFRFGFNLVFGSNRLKKQLQDKPLVL